MEFKQQKAIKSKGIIFQDLVLKYTRNWGWFVVSIAIFIGLGVVYNLSRDVEYSVSQSVRIGGGQASSNSKPSTSSDNIADAIRILKSPDLMAQAVENLRLDKCYYEKTMFGRRVYFYGNAPYSVGLTPLNGKEISKMQLSIRNINNAFIFYGMYFVGGLEKPFHEDARRLPVTIILPAEDGQLEINASGATFPPRCFVAFDNVRNVAAKLSKGLEIIKPASGQIISMNLRTCNSSMGAAVLNELVRLYNNASSNDVISLDDNVILLHDDDYYNDDGIFRLPGDDDYDDEATDSVDPDETPQTTAVAQPVVSRGKAEIISAPSEGEQVYPSDAITLPLFALLGLLFPAFIIFISECLRTVVGNVKEVSRLTDIKIIGEVSYDGNPLVINNENSKLIAENFRQLRNTIDVRFHRATHKLVLVTSSIHGEGKTFVSINLAMAFTLLNKRVLLVDADLRKPNMSKYLLSQSESGLTDLLANKTLKREKFFEYIDEFPNLHILQAGQLPDSPDELLMSERFKQFIESVKADYDYVIVDTPPIRTTHDAYAVAQYADMTLYVVREKLTPKRLLPRVGDITYEQLNNMYLVFNATKKK